MKKRVLPDEQLVTLYQETSNEGCFEELYARYVGKVYQQCLAITKDSEAAQDYTQDIFIKVFSKLGTFQQRSKFSTWLYSISRFYCYDRLQIDKRLPTQSLDDELPERFADLDQDDSKEEKLSNLERLLAGIPTQEVELLRLKYEQNMSIKELAQLYHLTESNVKMRLKRTRDKLYERHTAYFG
ncbi:RNA polymerase sigma factor [Spirosoma pomorum]